MKQIFLTQYTPPISGPTVYIVTKLVNDISLKIGQHVPHDRVRDLCDMPATWRVTITAEDKR